jgi:hypothetical protein
MSDLYDGPATIRVGDDEHEVRVRLRGHLDPIDGRYHWQGTAFDTLAADTRLPQPVTVRIGDGSAEARIIERTPQGGYSLAGVGAPPFPLEMLTISTMTAKAAPAIPEINSGS